MGWLWIFSVFLIALILFLINFYRDPKRVIPTMGEVISPADGKIISIKRVRRGETRIRKGSIGHINALASDISNDCYAISIFMSPFDVHINRSPISGTVKKIRHSSGKFFMANDLSRCFENEKNEITIENKKMKVKVIQIAGFLARRIKCYVARNQKVNKGHKIGMICLGSQTTLILPAKAGLKVMINQKVKAGETVIA